LKFHHQALPPEYLKHYKQQEKKRRITENRKVDISSSSNGGVDCSGLETTPTAVSNDQSNSTADAMQTIDGGLWTPTSFLPHLDIDITQNKAFIENLLTNQIEINRVENKPTPPPHPKVTRPRKPKVIPPSGRIKNFSDLPYMGEITLDGVKPRRGRKPKKADICHLIYKNYGQVFPGAPATIHERTKEPVWNSLPADHPNPAESPLASVSGMLNHTQIQNRIINSLLERRLTQKANPSSSTKANSTNEPLNLCVRDLKSLKIKLSRKHGNIYETKSTAASVKEEIEDTPVDVKDEIIELASEDSGEESEIVPFNLVTTELRDTDDDCDEGNLRSDSADIMNPGSGMYWPPSDYFYPPPEMLSDVCFPQKLHQPTSEKRPRKVNKSKSAKRLIPKQSQSSAQTMASRRKRSAIFIPPVPAESTANSTEVSICKFKFTGGAKPSLQEKKMLSVDSGGNFRYYSGTGDKSMRGYEFFPRESLQQCQENTGCSPSGVFLTASALGSGEKIPEDVGHSGFFDPTFPLQLTSLKNEPEVPVSKKKAKNDLLGFQDSPCDADLDGGESDSSSSLGREPLKRNRKSLAREKLEKTFKEKGFLIQTQQLESAEGATYCKFRQLRKFTRYLFRSWKDYLPGNVRDMNEALDGELVDGLPSPSSLGLNHCIE